MNPASRVAAAWLGLAQASASVSSRKQLESVALRKEALRKELASAAVTQTQNDPSHTNDSLCANDIRKCLRLCSVRAVFSFFSHLVCVERERGQIDDVEWEDASF